MDTSLITSAFETPRMPTEDIQANATTNHSTLDFAPPTRASSPTPTDEISTARTYNWIIAHGRLQSTEGSEDSAPGPRKHPASKLKVLINAIDSAEKHDLQRLIKRMCMKLPGAKKIAEAFLRVEYEEIEESSEKHEDDNELDPEDGKPYEQDIEDGFEQAKSLDDISSLYSMSRLVGTYVPSPKLDSLPTNSAEDPSQELDENSDCQCIPNSPIPNFEPRQSTSSPEPDSSAPESAETKITYYPTSPSFHYKPSHSSSPSSPKSRALDFTEGDLEYDPTSPVLHSTSGYRPSPSPSPSSVSRIPSPPGGIGLGICTGLLAFGSNYIPNSPPSEPISPSPEPDTRPVIRRFGPARAIASPVKSRNGDSRSEEVGRNGKKRQREENDEDGEDKEAEDGESESRVPKCRRGHVGSHM